MPKVHFGVEVYELDDEFYRSFLEELLIDDENIEFVMSGMSEQVSEQVSNYIKYRLSEVDPDYAPRPLTDT